MRTIILLCAAGMSTSALVRKMQEAAKADGYDCEISAHSVSDDIGATSSTDQSDNLKGDLCELFRQLIITHVLVLFRIHC